MRVRATGLLLLLLQAITPAISVAAAGCMEITGPGTLQSNTARIQAALDAAPGTADDQGCVSVGSGDWLVAGVNVSSNTSFVIQPGARLLSKINVTANAVVWINNAEHVTLSGGGGINGHAEEAWVWWSDKDARMAPAAADGSMARPNTLLVTGSRDVHVHHIYLHNSTDWTFKMVQSHDIYVDSIDIYGDERFPNNDGFDPMSCTNVTLINSHIEVADDGVCPKANSEPLRGLLVRNTTIRSRSGAIKFGSNTGPGQMSDIVFDNLTIWSSNGGLKIQSRGGHGAPADIVNVTWSNIIIETQYHAPRWWGNGEWLGISNSPRDDGASIGSMRQLRFINITGTSENGGLLSGISGSGATDVLFENVHIRIGSYSNYSKLTSTGKGPVGPGWPNGVMCQQDPLICSNDTKPKCVDQGDGSVGPPPPPGAAARSLPCMGTHDYRPHNNGNCSYYCRTPSKAHGLFVENVHGIVFKNVTFEYQLPRLSWFGNCLVVDNRSTGVIGAEDVKCINGPGHDTY